MARRLDKTLIDYLVIAVSPALIMTLIGSLIFFLLEVFYRGQYEIRLHYILGLFIVGAVLIGRISIEDGKERAMLFAGPLAIVTLLAINRFVEFRGVPFTFVINCALVGLIWWCAHKLTWDCTLIDEAEPDSGEGLLEAVGLDDPASDEPGSKGSAPEKPEAAASVVSPTPAWQEQIAGWWGRLIERRRRPHAPGLWVVYFSLAALPLFGIGQLLVPSDNLEGRQYVFKLLLVYVASGLSLLLATSFLGLRRYLRQRRLEMPLPMVNVWIGMGCALIVAVMALALLLPRPNAEYAVSKLPLTVGSPDRKSSRHGMGNDGVKEDRPWSRANQLDEKGSMQSNRPGDKGQSPSEEKGGQGGSPAESRDSKQNTSSAGKDAAGKDAASGQRPDKQEAEKGSPPGQQREKDSSRSDDQGEAGKPQPDKRDPSGQPQPKPPEEKSRSATDGKDAGAARDAGREKQTSSAPKQKTASAPKEAKGPSPGKANRQEPPPRDAREGKSTEARQDAPPKDARGTPPPPPRFSLPAGGGWLLVLFQWAFYLAILCLVGYWLWRHWDTVRAALRDFWKGCRDFWQSLFGRKQKAAEAAAEEQRARQPQLRPFAEFIDPFAAGLAGRYSPEELVKYSFLALEAWARENGCAREPEETPHELARHIGLRAPLLADDAGQLADLYCQVAYAAESLPASSVEPLRRLWRDFPREATAARMGP